MGNWRFSSVDPSDTVRPELDHQPVCGMQNQCVVRVHHIYRRKNINLTDTAFYWASKHSYSSHANTYSQSMTPSSRDFLKDEPNVLPVTA